MSYARALFDKTVTLGVTASALQGVVYLDRSFVQSSDTGLDFSKDFDQSESAWDASVDAGMTWTPAPYLRFAMVGKYLNRPSFDVFDADDINLNGVPPNLPPEILARARERLAQLQSRFELAPQGRASVDAFPMEGMTVTSDVLSRSRTGRHAPAERAHGRQAAAQSGRCWRVRARPRARR